MSSSQSLRSRLAWSASAVITLWVAVLTVGVNLVLASALARQADTLLHVRAEATATTVGTDADGRVTVADEHDDTALDVGTWIFAADGSIIESPPGTASQLDARAAELARRGTGRTDVGGATPVRLYALPVQDGAHRVATVVTSTSLAPYRQLRRLAWIASGLLAAGLIAGTHLVLRANVGRALRPVQEMAAQADRWSADDIDRRFGSTRRPAELQVLASTLDTVLERIRAVLRRERRLADELSHELRTPLTQIQAEVELLRDRPRSTEELAAGHDAIAEAAAVMVQTIETLMATARVSSAQAVSGRSVARTVVDVLAARVSASRPDVDVVVRVDDRLTIGVEPALLERLLSPVVENAARYARRRIEVSAGLADGRVRVLVVDDGPGVPEQARARVFEPGWRGDPADGHDGAGLGLSLAHRLAEAADGELRVLDGGPGGRFAVDLPPA